MTSDPAAIVARFLQIYRYLNQYSRRIASEFGISGRQLATLRHLSMSSSATIGELSNYLHVSDSSTSELVNGLEARGLVRRSRSLADNRVVKVSLTPEGEALVARAPLAGIGLLRERVGSLPETDRVVIAQALDRLAALLGVDEVKF